MYEIRFAGKNKKRFSKLLQKLSPSMRARLKDLLTRNPLPRPAYGDELCKVEKKGSVLCVEVTGGNRILFNVVEEQGVKAVYIRYAGDEDGEILFLRKSGKKKG